MMRQCGGLVPIGEVFGGLDGPVKAIAKSSPQARRGFTQADQGRWLYAPNASPKLMGWLASLAI